MLAARVHGPRDIRIEEVAGPPEPGYGEVLVRPTWCGLCGTDVKEYVGVGVSVPNTPHPITGATKPQILGHEFAAQIVSVGPGVPQARVGEHIAVMPLQHCGRCELCWQGHYLLCPNKAWIGLSTRWGGLGDLVLMYEYQATALGPLNDAQGALIEPAAVALNAVLRAGVDVGHSVLVVGAGPIGAMSTLAAQTAGAATVYVSEPNRERAKRVAELGAVVVDAESNELVQEVLAGTNGVGVDAALDCAGKPGTLDLCIAAAKPGATVVIPAVHSGPTPVNARDITRKPVTVAGSLGYSRQVWRQTIAAIATGKLDVEQLVSARISRANVVPEGFERLAQSADAGTKILVQVSDDGRVPQI